MKIVPRSSWFRILAGLAISVLAGEIFGPASARAGCGDYVTFGQESGKPEKPPCQQERQPGQAPCHGPRCGNDQPSAPLPPTTPQVVRVQDFAFLIRSPLEIQSEAIPLEAERDQQSRIHRTFLIYHPPRSNFLSLPQM
ncbi:MAG TPA: hypothetical protein VKE98_19150 [Gemmataceae bacterium]|nr:hypothetical protein [Gemmataceae bacterium]